MELILPLGLEEEIAGHARLAFPRECCGLIEGVWEKDSARALALHPAPPGAARRFSIAPVLHFAAIRTARANGHAIIGCYHSHPGGAAEPSMADAQGAGEENFLWLIAALADGDAQPLLQAHLYLDGGFAPIGVVTGADLVTSSSKMRY